MEKITADEAARLIEDGDSILISGSGGGHAVPEALLAAVERRFVAEGKPLGLTSVSVVGVGDRAALGASHLARNPASGRVLEKCGMVLERRERRPHRGGAPEDMCVWAITREQWSALRAA